MRNAARIGMVNFAAVPRTSVLLTGIKENVSVLRTDDVAYLRRFLDFLSCNSIDVRLIPYYACFGITLINGGLAYQGCLSGGCIHHEGVGAPAPENGQAGIDGRKDTAAL